jgi:undecaprenyl pyrophosphate phosphatase UppP
LQVSPFLHDQYQMTLFTFAVIGGIVAVVCEVLFCLRVYAREGSTPLLQEILVAIIGAAIGGILIPLVEVRYKQQAKLAKLPLWYDLLIGIIVSVALVYGLVRVLHYLYIS